MCTLCCQLSVVLDALPAWLEWGWHALWNSGAGRARPWVDCHSAPVGGELCARAEGSCVLLSLSILAITVSGTWESKKMSWQIIIVTAKGRGSEEVRWLIHLDSKVCLNGAFWQSDGFTCHFILAMHTLWARVSTVLSAGHAPRKGAWFHCLSPFFSFSSSTERSMCLCHPPEVLELTIYLPASRHQWPSESRGPGLLLCSRKDFHSVFW